MYVFLALRYGMMYVCHVFFSSKLEWVISPVWKVKLFKIGKKSYDGNFWSKCATFTSCRVLMHVGLFWIDIGLFWQLVASHMLQFLKRAKDALTYIHIYMNIQAHTQNTYIYNKYTYKIHANISEKGKKGLRNSIRPDGIFSSVACGGGGRAMGGCVDKFIIESLKIRERFKKKNQSKSSLAVYASVC